MGTVPAMWSRHVGDFEFTFLAGPRVLLNISYLQIKCINFFLAITIYIIKSIVNTRWSHKLWIQKSHAVEINNLTSYQITTWLVFTNIRYEPETQLPFSLMYQNNASSRIQYYRDQKSCDAHCFIAWPVASVYGPEIRKARVFIARIVRKLMYVYLVL